MGTRGWETLEITGKTRGRGEMGNKGQVERDLGKEGQGDARQK